MALSMLTDVIPMSVSTIRVAKDLNLRTLIHSSWMTGHNFTLPEGGVSGDGRAGVEEVGMLVVVFQFA